MFRGCELTAAVASQQISGHNLLERIVVQPSGECKSQSPKREAGLNNPGPTTHKSSDDGCAPGMVSWVLASHNRRRSPIRVPTLETRSGGESRVTPRAFLRHRFPGLRRKWQHRLGVWT